MHPYDQPAVVAGQGTLAAELSGQAPALDTVIVAVGGGGLIAGVAAWYATDTRVIGVEPQRCPTLSRALASGEPVDVEVGGVAADALGAQRAGLIALGIAARFVPQVVLVSDEDIMRARQLLWEHAASSPSPARPRRLRRCSVGPTSHGPASGSGSSCAAETPTRRIWPRSTRSPGDRVADEGDTLRDRPGGHRTRA